VAKWIVSYLVQFAGQGLLGSGDKMGMEDGKGGWRDEKVGERKRKTPHFDLIIR
jgi:hypothetical protein